jgi:hypothetical protein
MRRLHTPNGMSKALRQTGGVNSGNRSACFIALSWAAALVAADAGRVDGDDAHAMWVAPELVQLMEFRRGGGTCEDVGVPRHADLALASVAHHPALDASRIRALGRERIVVFEWNPQSGELTFDTAGVQTTALNVPDAVATSAPAELDRTSNCDW